MTDKIEEPIKATFDDLSPGLNEYLKHNRNRLKDGHNVYHIQTHDRDGNLTGEAFATNILLDQGMNLGFRWRQSSYYRRIMIGSGTTPPQPTDTALEKHLYTSDDNKTTVNISSGQTIYSAVYNKETGFFTAQYKWITAYWDYNISGVTEPFDITEIGYTGGHTALCSRALVETSDGKNAITKKPNERLTITMYLISGYHVSLINDLWDKGYYAVIQPYYMQPRNYDSEICRFYTSFASLYSGKTSDTNITFTMTKHDEVFHDQTYTDRVLTSKNIVMDSYLLEDKTLPIQGSFLQNRSDMNWWSAMRVYHRELLDVEEELTHNACWTYEQNSDRLDYNFCYVNKTTADRRGEWGLYRLPVYDFNIKSIQLYNHETQAYDIDVPFINPYWNDYSELTHLGAGMSGIWMQTGENRSNTVYIVVNPHADKLTPDGEPIGPITAINTAGVVAYTSDEYWDWTTWKLIDNVKKIPPEQQNARYYIFLSRVNNESGDYWDDHLMSFTRTRMLHRIHPETQQYTMCPELTLTLETGQIQGGNLSDEEHGWFIIPRYICYPDTSEGFKYYPLHGPGDKTHYHHGSCRWSWGDRVIVRTQGNAKDWYSWNTEEENNGPDTFYYQQRRLRMYYTDNPDQLTPPEYVDIVLEWDKDINRTTLENTYSYTDQGYLVIWRWKTCDPYETIVIDVYGEDGRTPIQYKLPFQTVYAHALNCTDYMVYIKRGSNPDKVYLYNMRTKEETFLLEPMFDGGVNGINGWKNHVYIHGKHGGSWVTMLYDINTGTSVMLNTGYIPEFVYAMDPAYQHIADFPSNEECLVITKGCMLPWDHYNSANLRIIFDNNPETIRSLMDNSSYTGDFDTSSQSWGFQLKYLNGEKKHLLLTFQNSFYSGHNVVDIGYLIDNNKTETDNPPYRKYDTSVTNYKSYGYCVFWKNGIITYDNNPDDRHMTWRPIEQFMRLKMTGTTRTIQAYNNPKRIGGKSWRIALTNDTSKLRNQPETPEETPETTEGTE